MSTHTDNFRQVLFSAGEGAEPADFNNVQRFPLAILSDQVLRALAYGGHFQVKPSTGGANGPVEGSLYDNAAGFASDQFALSLTGGGPYFEPTANAREVSSSGGILLQHVAAADGTEPKLLMFEVPAGVLFTLAVGDATNPRLDIIEAKLEYIDDTSTSRDFKDGTTGVLSTSSTNKAHRVRCTLQVKQGTPAAAASLRYPTPTSGYCAVAAVYVPATHNAVFVRTQMRTLTLPLGAKEYFVGPNQFHRGQNAANWDEDTSNPSRRSVIAPAAATEMLIYPPVVGPNARVLGVNIFANFAQAPSTLDLVRVGFGAGAPTITSLCNLATDANQAGAYGNARRHLFTMGSIGKLTSNLDSGAKPDVDTTGKIMDPMWCNGQKAGPAMEDVSQGAYSGANYFDKLALRINDTTGGSEIWGVSWIIASGL